MAGTIWRVVLSLLYRPVRCPFRLLAVLVRCDLSNDVELLVPREPGAASPAHRVLVENSAIGLTRGFHAAMIIARVRDAGLPAGDRGVVACVAGAVRRSADGSG